MLRSNVSTAKRKHDKIQSQKRNKNSNLYGLRLLAASQKGKEDRIYGNTTSKNGSNGAWRLPKASGKTGNGNCMSIVATLYVVPR